MPWRRLFLFGIPTIALAGVGIWLVLDAASESKRERAAVEARAKMRTDAAKRRRVEAEQRLRRARVSPAPRPKLVEALERRVLADARRRVAAGDLGQPVRRVECEPHPRTAPRRAEETDPSRRSGRYHCLAVTSDIVGVGEGTIGYPFLARIHYRTAALAWCKINPVPGEQSIPDPRNLVRLSRRCS